MRKKKLKVKDIIPFIETRSIGFIREGDPYPEHLFSNIDFKKLGEDILELDIIGIYPYQDYFDEGGYLNDQDIYEDYETFLDENYIIFRIK